MILAGDVGGTKTNLALFSTGSERTEPVAAVSIPNAEHDSLESVLGAFPELDSASIGAAALGVAGPVVDGVSRITHLPWIIRETALAERLGIRRVRLLNDLAATARGLEVLREDEIETLQAGSHTASGNRAVIAAGTGLGQALVIPTDGRSLTVPSEGGHVEFGPRDEVEVDLWRWLRERLGRVEYESVLSGPGLVHLYRFFHQEFSHADPWDDTGESPAAAVSRAAMSGACTACRESLERFVTIYGAEAGNLALKVMATGGVFVAGGIAPRVLPVLRDGRFVDAFNDKGAFSDLTRSIPVRVVLNDRTALLGAARVASEL